MITAEDRIANLERQRCAALVAGDGAALAALIAEDLVHIHGHGGVDDRKNYLSGVAKTYIFHEVERGPLNIRIYGNVAIVTGTLHQIYSERATGVRYRVQGVTTQTWVMQESEWRQNTCHNNFLKREVEP